MPVPVANISLDTGWAKCNACEEIFPLAGLVPGFPALDMRSTVLPERPYNARAIVERSTDELLVKVPAEGMRAATWGTLGLAIFWLGFTTFWTLGALGVLVNQPIQPINWAFACFSIPLWVAGFALLGTVAWKACGTKAVDIDWQGMRTEARCLAWSRTQLIELDRIQHARPFDPLLKQYEWYRRSQFPWCPHGVEIVYRTGSFVLSVDHEEEERWLIAEINDFVKSIAA
jgi:hypothetical protein